MKQVTKTEFLDKLFKEDRKGKEILLNATTYEYRDTKTNELFGEIKPLVNGFEYYLS